MSGKTMQQKLIDQLERMIQEIHSDNHVFVPREDEPHICCECGWIDPEKEAPQGSLTRDRAQALLAALKSGQIQIGEPRVIQVHIYWCPSIWDLFK